MAWVTVADGMVQTVPVRQASLLCSLFFRLGICDNSDLVTGSQYVEVECPKTEFFMGVVADGHQPDSFLPMPDAPIFMVALLVFLRQPTSVLAEQG
jgi:hypothetical protein